MNAKETTRGHSFEDYFKRAVNPMVVMSLLIERPKYAYEMTQELKDKTNSEYTMPLLYPVLYRLQNQGFIEEAEKLISENNRVRNYYRLTPLGYQRLEEMKQEYLQLCRNVDDLVDLSETT
ncbi:MAG: PadR family transcriptional regulator [Clostridiales bacterium]|nr:PadR family transcriptional regulator [Clostridiales bacterium]